MLNMIVSKGVRFVKKTLINAKKWAKKVVANAKKIAKASSKNVFLSLGENCLADNILDRNGLKSFSSPYAFGASNIEYILSFEKEGFLDFLNPDYLKKESFISKPDVIVVRNKKYLKLNNRYNGLVSNGFEFTHHDVLDDISARDTLHRRCERMLKLRKKRIVFLYHHRYCDETDYNLLIIHLNQLAQIYRDRGNEVSINVFSQSLVSSVNERRVEYHLDNGINSYVFYTLNEWAGDNEEYLWAKCDDDLIGVMINDIRQSLRKK